MQRIIPLKNFTALFPNPLIVSLIVPEVTLFSLFALFSLLLFFGRPGIFQARPRSEQIYRLPQQ